MIRNLNHLGVAASTRGAKRATCEREIQTIELFDGEMEKATVIRAYLDIIHGEPGQFTVKGLEFASDLLAFIDKYDGSSAQRHLVLNQLLDSSNTGISGRKLSPLCQIR